ncbi:MAG: hypothetical protein SGBAC_008256, partial [Bacillariaceae sp.]
MVFSEKSVTGIVLGLALATNLSSGFAPHEHSSQARTSSTSISLGSFAGEEWFYEEKKILYSDEETERSKRIYATAPGAKTKVFHDNYPLSPTKTPAAKLSPYLPVAVTTDQRWFTQETTLSYDATLRQRIAPPKPTATKDLAAASPSDEQGMRAPMPAIVSTDATAKSPYQSVGYSEKTTKTAASSIPVANNSNGPKPATLIAKPVALRPEDVVATEGRWFNNESMVSYGNLPRSRHYKSIKPEHKDELPQHPSSKPAAPMAKLVPLRPEDVVATEGRWFNNESMISYGTRPRSRHYKSVKAEHKEMLAEQQQAESPFVPVSTTATPSTPQRSSMDVTTTLPLKTPKEGDVVVSPEANGDEELTVAAKEEEKEEETPEAAAARIAAIVASTVTTDDRWFNSETRDFFRPAQKQIPYTIRNPEYHRSPNMIASDEELSSGSPSAGAFVNVGYSPTTPTVPTARSSEITEPAPVTEVPSMPRVATELLPLTATTDQKWFNAESKGTYFSGVRDVREHKPYTIRNPEMHRNPNMLRAEQQAANSAYVSVNYNPPAAPAAPTVESKPDETENAAPSTPTPKEVTTQLPKSMTTSTDDKWFNAESKGTYFSGVGDLREQKPYTIRKPEMHRNPNVLRA